MTPAELAEDLEARFAEAKTHDDLLATGSLPAVGIVRIVDMPLLSAALRLAEAVDALASPPEDLNSIPDLIAKHSVAHLAYRSARERLANDAP